MPIVVWDVAVSPKGKIVELVVVVYDPSTGRPLPVLESSAGDHVLLAHLQIERPASTVLRRPLADFGPVHLVEATTPAKVVSSGYVVPVSLLWQAAVDSARGSSWRL